MLVAGLLSSLVPGLGQLYRGARRRGLVLLALAAGIGLLLLVEAWEPLFGGSPPFGWIWNAPIGCLATLAIGALFAGRRP